MISPRDKLEPRGENEPRFDPNNKTDRSIFKILTISVVILTIIAVGCFLIYFLVFQK